jgi:F0F1-type ATP synthase beta subunit
MVPRVLFVPVVKRSWTPGPPFKYPLAVILGCIMNVIGEPIDERSPIKGVARKPIHADPPPSVEPVDDY